MRRWLGFALAAVLLFVLGLAAGRLGSEGPAGPEGPVGPSGPTGPEGPAGESPDIFTFNEVVPVGDTADLVDAGGWLLTGECGETYMSVVLRHTSEPWKRMDLAWLAPGEGSQINVAGITPGGFGENTIGRINAYTEDGSVFLASETDSIMAAIGGGTACVFAGAPHVHPGPGV